MELPSSGFSVELVGRVTTCASVVAAAGTVWIGLPEGFVSFAVEFSAAVLSAEGSVVSAVSTASMPVEAAVVS